MIRPVIYVMTTRVASLGPKPHLKTFMGEEIMSQKYHILTHYLPLCPAKRSVEIGAGSSSPLMLVQHSVEFHTRRSYAYQYCQRCHNYLSVFLIPLK
jgi:hypothetical protein